MSNSEIINQITGKIEDKYLPPFPVESQTLQQVLTNGNSTGGIAINGTGSNIIADTVKLVSLEAVSAPLYNDIGVIGNFVMEAPAEIRYLGDAIIESASGDLKINLNEASSPLSKVLSYDTTSNKVFYQDGGGSGIVNSVNSGDNINVDNTDSANPIINVEINQDLNMNTKNITNATNITAIGNVECSELLCSNIETYSNIQPVSGVLDADILNYRNITATNEVNAPRLVSTGIVETMNLTCSGYSKNSNIPTDDDDLTNKLYVDDSINNIIEFKPSYTLYVAKNGNDTTGDGSLLNPYLTIQKAYNEAILSSSSANIYAINISSGHYTENLNLVGKSYVWLIGSVQQGIMGGVGETTEIIGDITINQNGGDDLYNKVLGFVNLQIDGSLTVSSVSESSLVIKDCKFYSSNRAIYINASATDYRTYISDTSIQHQSAGVGTDSLVEISKGWLYANNSTWNAKNNSSVLTSSGAGVAIRITGIVMESDNSSALLAPIVKISTTNLTINTIAQCSMTASSATVKTTPAILINSSAALTINLLQNYFGINGTSVSGNVIQYSGTIPTLQIGANASQFGTSSIIQTGIITVSTQAVGISSFGQINANKIIVNGTGPTVDAITVNNGAVSIGGVLYVNGTSGTEGLRMNGGPLNMNGRNIDNASAVTINGSGAGVYSLRNLTGATELNGRVNVTGHSSNIAVNVNTGSSTSNVIEMNNGTLSLNGAANMKINQNSISSTTNNIGITGLNTIQMTGTTNSITGVKSINIANDNATTPLTITNSGDNPHIVLNNSGSSTLIPVEMSWVNGTTLAIGNQNVANGRGAFMFYNTKDIFRVNPVNYRMVQNYSPYSPCLANSAANGIFTPAPTGPWVSGTPKLLGTQTIVLSPYINFPIIDGGFGVEAYMGLNGFINTCSINGKHDIQIYVTYERVRGGVTVGPYNLYGATYNIETRSDGAFYSPLNGVTYNELTPAQRVTFNPGTDTVIFKVYGLYTGAGSPPTTSTAPTGLAAVISPFFY